MRRILLLSGLLIGNVSWAWGQVPGPPSAPSISILLAPQVGLAVASGDVADVWEPSLAVGGAVDVPVAPQFVLSGVVFYNEFSPKSTLSDENASILEVSAAVKYRIVPAPVVKPYVRFGLGLYRRDTGGPQTNSNFGAHGGGGVDIDVPRSRLGVTATARFHKIFITSTSFQNPSWQYFNLTVGVRLRVL